MRGMKKKKKKKLIYKDTYITNTLKFFLFLIKKLVFVLK